MNSSVHLLKATITTKKKQTNKKKKTKWKLWTEIKIVYLDRKGREKKKDKDNTIYMMI